MRSRWLAGVAGLVVLALLAAGVVWWRSVQATEIEQAVSLAPADAERLTFTDWSGVRRTLDADLDARSSTEQLDAFLSEAFDADLSSMSALVESAETMQAKYGFSPATLDWELLSQSTDGTVVLMRLPEGIDFDALTDGFERLGYQRPDDEGGVWAGGRDLLPKIGGTLTPELQYLAVDPGQRLVVGSDRGPYLAHAMRTVTGDADSVAGLDPVVEATGEPLAAAVYSGRVACSRLAMSGAGAADQAQAEDLIAAAGEVNPVTGFAMAAEPGGGVRVAMSFETEEQARTNADTRAELASGPAVGQGGDFSDRFRLGTVRAQDEVVTMELHPREGAYVLSDLSSGPVLFATC